MLRSVRRKDASNKETKGQALRVVTDYRYSATGSALRSIAVGSSPGRCPSRTASPPERRPGPARRTGAVPRDPRDPLSLAIEPAAVLTRAKVAPAARRSAVASPTLARAPRDGRAGGVGTKGVPIRSATSGGPNKGRLA